MQTIETTAGQIKDELERRGIGAAVPVTVIVDPVSKLLWDARASVRPSIQAAGLTDEDIDAMIARARLEVAAEKK